MRICVFVLSLLTSVLVCAEESYSFRDLFFTVTPTDVNEEIFSKLYVDPQDSMFGRSISQSSAESFLDTLEKRFNRFSSESLRKKTRRPKFINLESLHRQLENKDLALVILPGVFSEFIEYSNFEKLFDADKVSQSFYHQKWIKALERVAGTEMAYDKVFELKTMLKVKRELRELVNVTSIKQLKIISLKAPRFSLETISSLPEMAKIYVERLTQVFNVLGETPKNIVLVGYSMGTITGLEMLSNQFFQQQPQNWLKKVVGMVALGGVTWGSAAADEAMFDVESLAHRQVLALRQLVVDLKAAKDQSFYTASKKIYSAWSHFFSAMWDLLPGVSGRVLSLRQYMDNVVLTPLFRALGDVYAHSFALNPISFVRDRDMNIAKFERLVTSALKAVENLSTRARLKWWSEHRVPTQNFHYYALAATFSSQVTETGLQLLDNPHAHAAESVEYKIQANGHTNLFQLTGNALNDGQVAADRVPFWPELISFLNPQNADLKAQFLGLATTSHWGLTLTHVFPIEGQEYANPYPREALLYALGLKVVSDL